ncbi:putative bifunctional diguanylate cyclase/phosphodiesterase [Phenylobacterium terrae]
MTLLAPLLGASVLAIVALFGATMVLGLAVNHAADRREQRLVETAVRAAPPQAVQPALKDARLADRPEPGRLAAAIAPGEYLTWRSSTLGYDVLARMAPLVAGIAGFLAGWGYWMYRRTRRVAEELVASEAQAQHLSLHDPMTGLANRALFHDRLSMAMNNLARSGGVVAVFCIDLDRFKQVNDTLGHQAGDEFIREAAQRLAACCRKTDTVARLGGDEFAIVAPSAEGREGVQILADRIVHALSGRLELAGGQAVLSCSVGVSIVDDDFTDSDEAIRQADLALYRAKEEGRGRYTIYGEEMDEKARLRQQMEVELREALSDELLQVHYQPRFAADGRLESVEALARWNHPRRGMVSPAVFIPLAEESGLIHEIGEFIMREACRTAARRWPELILSVNVSPVELSRPDFLERTCAIMAEAGIDPHKVEIEITEGALLQDDEKTQSLLRTLRELGFTLALDDFGTGYSSLSYLHLYPVDRIKIDRSFVSNLGNAEVEKLVRAMIQLAQALDLEVTAEGVETADQHAALVSAGCNQLQGYFLGRPGEPEDIDALLKTRRKTSAAA